MGVYMNEINVMSAYFDPGAGSVLFQILFGFFFAFVFFFNKIKSFFSKDTSDKKNDLDNERKDDKTS